MNTDTAYFQLIKELQRKLERKEIKVARLNSLCQSLDRRRDGFLHIDEFESLLRDFLGSEMISRRSMHLLVQQLSGEKKDFIDYVKFVDELEAPTLNGIDKEERWKDNSSIDNDHCSWAQQPGSIGEWMTNVACPAELRNYQLLFQCLESFERESGMKIRATSDGLVVPLGPDLRAAIRLYTER